MKTKATLNAITLSFSLMLMVGCQSPPQPRPVPAIPQNTHSASSAKVLSQRAVPGKELTNEEIQKLIDPNTPAAERQRLMNKEPHVEGIIQQ